jgi:hypothetical protein
MSKPDLKGSGFRETPPNWARLLPNSPRTTGVIAVLYKWRDLLIFHPLGLNKIRMPIGVI